MPAEIDGLVCLFNGKSTFVGYLMAKHPYRNTVVVLFNWEL